MLEWFASVNLTNREPTRNVEQRLTSGELTLKLTLLLLLLYPPGSPTLGAVVQVGCGAMLLLPRLLHVPSLWALLAMAVLVGTAKEWYVTDNHRFLIAYWVGACAIAVRLRNGEGFLRHTAAVLVGLVFLCATTWKLIAGQYIDGSFFYLTLLIDNRLQNVGSLIAGWKVAEAKDIREAVGFLGHMGATDVAVTIGGPAMLKLAALIMSWLALAVEATVGVCHILTSPTVYRLRQYSLIGFCFGTYYLMPVPGFAFILCVLGFSACRPDDDSMRLWFLIMLASLQLTILPWQDLLSNLVVAA